jgi:hypothetical protein
MNKQADAVEMLKGLGGVETTKAKPKTPRSDLKGIISQHPPEVRKQLKLICAEQDKTQQELLEEALNMLFRRYDKPPIA